MPVRQYAVLEAPSTLGLAGTGVEKLPTRLLELGLARRLNARLAGKLNVPDKKPEVDRDTGVLNAPAIASWSPQLADSLTGLFESGEFPVVLGGDCTIVLGTMLALRRRGRYGLLFIDGNADFFQPEAEPHGEGASMDLALVTGYGPEPLTNLEGLKPIVRPEDVVAFGYRDHEDQREYGSQPLPAEMKVIDLPRVRELGIRAATDEAIAHLAKPELEGFFIHVDADCLDDQLMPAVDFRVAGGMSPDELRTVLRTAIASGRAVGIEIAIYNPLLDKDGSAGRRLVDCLVGALA